MTDWAATRTVAVRSSYKHLIYMLYALHTHSLCSFSVTLTLAFVNQMDKQLASAILLESDGLKMSSWNFDHE